MGWKFGNPKQYKNRDCNWCDLEPNGEDCWDRQSDVATCPFAPQIDALPSDSTKWICPGHCKSMPSIPYQLKVVKTRFYFEDSRTKSYDESPDVRTVTMPTAFNTRWDVSCDSDKQSADPNNYAVCPISECKLKRSQENFNARVVDCWQWSSLSGKPQMTHLDLFWTDKEARAYIFDGIKTNTYTISKCATINNAPTFLFHDRPCWMESSEDKKDKQFFIKPHYTYYRSVQSVSDRTDCRIKIVGSNGDGNTLLPGEMNEWNINQHWQNPPTRRNHYYNVYSVFDGMQRSGFSGFHNKEDKTIAKWEYTIPCKQYDNQRQSTQVIYAESGCNYPACVDFITKPCYDNVYRYDEMVCTLISDNFKQGPISFSNFKDKIIRLTEYRQPFMSYGLHDGSSYFDIWYDTAKVQVKRDATILDPSVPHIFADGHTISVSLVRGSDTAFSCDACFDTPLYGRLSLTDNAMANDIIACRACLAYEKVYVTASTRNYQDCVACAPHQVRNPAQANECQKCNDINALTPMRRRKTDTTGDTVCTTCQHFQYFNGESDAGCIFLPIVTDNIQVTGTKAALFGKDYYVRDEIRKEVETQFYRDTITPDTPWNRELAPQACAPSYAKPTTNVPRLEFTAFCGHHEMLRHQQAWLRLHGGMLYLPLNSDQARTRVNTSVVELCGTDSLRKISGDTAVDLACGNHKFSIIRSGFQDPCTLCLGAKFTDKCWPTYVPGLEVYDDAYFLPKNKALTPQPGTCAACNARCDSFLQPDHFIDPVEYSCWWDGAARIPGVLGSAATNFSWYKPAPCTKCDSAKLTPDTARLVLSCGNRIAYRRWTDTVTRSDLNPTRSVPDIQVCCAESTGGSTATECTDNPAEFQTFAQDKCRQTVDDKWPVTLEYCPRGWYVENACALASALWNPDCCVKCKACRGGKFKTDAYYDCPGDEFFDSQDRGCTTSCLTNQYLRNERCIKCEACE